MLQNASLRYAYSRCSQLRKAQRFAPARYAAQRCGSVAALQLRSTYIDRAAPLTIAQRGSAAAYRAARLRQAASWHSQRLHLPLAGLLAAL